MLHDSTKSHILFIHGFGFRNELFGMKYWGSIPQYLEGLGYETTLLKSSAYSPAEINHSMLTEQFHDLIKRYPKKKFVIIGHSRGGVDALYLLQDPIIASKVSSAVLLNSPVFGTESARRILDENKDPNAFVFRYRQILGQIMGGPRAKAQVCLRELANDHSAILTEVLNTTNLTIHWYYSKLKYMQLSRLWKIIVKVSYGKNSIGDGIVNESPMINHPRLHYHDISELEENVLGYHWSLTGLPKLIRGYGHNIYHSYNRILRDISASHETEKVIS